MADDTMDVCLNLSTTKINAVIDLITKIKKQSFVLLFCWCVVYIFSSRKSVF